MSDFSTDMDSLAYVFNESQLIGFTLSPLL